MRRYTVAAATNVQVSPGGPRLFPMFCIFYMAGLTLPSCLLLKFWNLEKKISPICRLKREKWQIQSTAWFWSPEKVDVIILLCSRPATDRLDRLEKAGWTGNGTFPVWLWRQACIFRVSCFLQPKHRSNVAHTLSSQDQTFVKTKLSSSPNFRQLCDGQPPCEDDPPQPQPQEAALAGEEGLCPRDVGHGQDSRAGGRKDARRNQDHPKTRQKGEESGRIWGENSLLLFSLFGSTF